MNKIFDLQCQHPETIKVSHGRDVREGFYTALNEEPVQSNLIAL